MMRMMNPAKAAQWAAAIATPSFHAPMFRFMDPGFYTARMQWLSDADTFKPLMPEPAGTE
jgi:dihydroorotase